MDDEAQAEPWPACPYTTDGVALLHERLKQHEAWLNTSSESEFVPGTVRVEATAEGYTVTGQLKGQIKHADFGMEVLL